MSEGREQDTGEGAEANLEALLEQFREPEEPRKAAANPLWFILAVLVSCLACWMAARAAGGSFGPEHSGPVKMKPTKVRDRGIDPPRFTGDVAEDFAARCRRGMSALEVRWVLEDFQAAGLDEGPGSLVDTIGTLAGRFPEWKPLEGAAADKLDVLLERLSARQRAWYRGALADALRLDRGQTAEVKRNLALTREELARSQPEDAPDMPGPSFHGPLPARAWLADERHAPWNLCALSPGQLAVTRHDEVVRKQLHVISTEGGGEAAVPSWFDLRPAAGRGGLTGPEQALLEAEAFFPLAAGQVPEENDEMLAMAKGLHPAQLKTLLLLEPACAGALLAELEARGE